MEENNSLIDIKDKEENDDNGFSILYLFLYRWKLLLIFLIIGLALGFAYGELKVKTSYKAEKSVILITNFQYEGEVDASLSAELSLAAEYLNQTCKLMKEGVFIQEANKIYNKENDKITSSSIYTTQITKNSLLFTVGYNDTNRDVVEEKLNAVIQATNNLLCDYIDADAAKLEVVQYGTEIKETNNKTTYTTVGAIAGLVIGVALVFFLYFMDNTAKDKDEIERLTGESVIAYIEDTDIQEKKKKHKK